MSEQLALVAPLRALSRATDPATSHAAARRMKVGSLYYRIVESLMVHGPGTSHELSDRLGIQLVSVSPRLKPLEVSLYVSRAGERDGRTVWDVTANGVTAAYQAL